jgi:hypothetical protein
MLHKRWVENVRLERVFARIKILENMPVNRVLEDSRAGELWQALKLRSSEKE